MKEKRRISAVRLGITAAGVLLAALVLAACSNSTSSGSSSSSGSAGTTGSEEGADPPFTVDQPWGTFTLKPSIAAKVRSGEKANYIFSYIASGIALFSQQYKQGFEEGCEAGEAIYPLSCEAIAPVQPNPNEQLSQLETKLAAGQVDCASINPTSADAMTPLINRMMSEGIPVFTVGIGTGGNEFTNFAQVPKQEGETAGRTVLEWMKKTGKNLKVFALSGGEPTQVWAQGRMKYFRETIEAAIPDAKFINTEKNPLTVPFDPGQAYDATKTFLSAHPEVEFIENVDIGAEQINKAIGDVGNEGKTYTIGWNLSEGQLDAIEAGTQVALLDQRWVDQAAFGGKACAEFFATGRVLPNTQKLRVVTAEQVPAARRELEALETS